MTSPYRQQIEQARQQRDAELAEAERIYAIAPRARKAARIWRHCWKPARFPQARRSGYMAGADAWPGAVLMRPQRTAPARGAARAEVSRRSVVLVKNTTPLTSRTTGRSF